MTTTNDTNGTTAALARVPQQTHAIEPANFAELKALAVHAAKTQFFGARDESQAILLMMRGKDLGLSYAQSLSAFHVVQGKPVLSADAMVAVCLARPDLCAYFRHVSSDDTHATFATKRMGEPEQVETYTMEDAKREQLAGKDMWKKFPKRMLKARAKSNLARDTYPELLLGIYSPEEMEAPARAPEVVVAVEPTIVRDPDARAAFLQAIADSTSLAALKVTGQSIQAALRQGVIDADDDAAIRAAYNARREAIQAAKRAREATVPAPPPSEPKSDADVAAAVDAGEA